MKLLGIDIGGTQVKCRAFDGDGHVLAQCMKPIAVQEETVSLVQAMVADVTGIVGCAPDAIGLGLRGLADMQEQKIVDLPHDRQGITGLNWAEAMAFRGPVRVLNDAHAALLGELWLGAGRGLRHLVFLTLGTGVGGALVIDGKLHRGQFGKAGLLGHLCLDLDGEPGVAGMPGSLEDFIGNQTVERRSQGRFLSTHKLVEAVRAGDSEAQRIWDRSIYGLACGLASVANLLDPEAILIGGGIAEAGDTLFEPLRVQVEKLEWRLGDQGTRILPARMGTWAGTCGAAYRAMQALKENRGEAINE